MRQEQLRSQLLSKQGARPEELLTSPEERAEAKSDEPADRASGEERHTCATEQCAA